MTKFGVGDKVRVIKNSNSYMKAYVGKEGKITGGLTPSTCRVKLAYDEELTFDLRELELVKASTTAPVETKTTAIKRGKQ